MRPKPNHTFLFSLFLAVVLAAPLTAQRATPRQGGTLVIAGASDLQLMNSLVSAESMTDEVINNVLFQSQCAIVPLRIDSDGEQVDQIKE